MKLVYPQEQKEAQLENFVNMDFDNSYVEPMDNDQLESNTRATIKHCLDHPGWKLNLQSHKLIGID